ncbi:hypothetical protein P154DRAFT_205082 [Amniculicola lignicola CBS 123094]|uniref:Uncharacterized protein n=1 Tax=Amniculicola lignicola CBS 123094 TaxID=1392246 RepID=A0A6A5WHH4_9PLEO|nr:hypothetical protein P154DRAFT_205082 [Amniculicola lignicola CBS 123094]
MMPSVDGGTGGDARSSGDRSAEDQRYPEHCLYRDLTLLEFGQVGLHQSKRLNTKNTADSRRNHPFKMCSNAPPESSPARSSPWTFEFGDVQYLIRILGWTCPGHVHHNRRQSSTRHCRCSFDVVFRKIRCRHCNCPVVTSFAPDECPTHAGSEELVSTAQ